MNLISFIVIEVNKQNKLIGLLFDEPGGGKTACFSFSFYYNIISCVLYNNKIYLSLQLKTETVVPYILKYSLQG